MTTRQPTSVRVLSGGMSQEDQQLSQQQQQQLLMQKVLPTSSNYTAPLYSLASNADCSRVRSVPPTNRIRGNDKSIVCNLCYEVFSSKPNLLIHSQQVHRTNPKPYQCPTCNKCFANSSYLSQHSRIHLGIKPYVCPLCHRRFTQLCHLQQHIRTHTGEKPYKCQHPGCSKAFSQLSNLQSHLRSHVTGHVHGQRRSSQTYQHCHSCCRTSADDLAAGQTNPPETTFGCCKMSSCLTQRIPENQGIYSDPSYRSFGLRTGNPAIPNIPRGMSNSIHAHTGNDETPSAKCTSPTLPLVNLSHDVNFPVRIKKGSEEGLAGSFGSGVVDHDLSTRVIKDTYLRHYEWPQVRRCTSETTSSVQSIGNPWVCGEAERVREKCSMLNTLVSHSGSEISTAKQGAFFTSELNARMKLCNTLFMEMNAGMRSYKNVPGKIDPLDDEFQMLPVEMSSRLKRSILPFDEFGTGRKTLDLMPTDTSSGRELKIPDSYQSSEKKRGFFSEVPRVNIDQPLSPPDGATDHLDDPSFQATFE